MTPSSVRQFQVMVGRHGDIDQSGLGQVRLSHQFDEGFPAAVRETGIVALFPADRRDRLALLVVSRPHVGVLGQCKQLACHAVVQRFGAAALEIGAAAALYANTH